MSRIAIGCPGMSQISVRVRGGGGVRVRVKRLGVGGSGTPQDIPWQSIISRKYIPS